MENESYPWECDLHGDPKKSNYGGACESCMAANCYNAGYEDGIKAAREYYEEGFNDGVDKILDSL